MNELLLAMKSVLSIYVLLFVIFSHISAQLFQTLLPDGKYCPKEQLDDRSKRSKDKSSIQCIIIRTKYPYLIIWEENQERDDKHGIYVGKPESWPDVVDLKSKTAVESELHFILHNASFHFHSHPHHRSIHFTLNVNGSLFLQPVKDTTFERLTFIKATTKPSSEHYCTMKGLIPGRWKYDFGFDVPNEKKSESCPLLYPVISNVKGYAEDYFHCPTFHALQYFPYSNCHVLPLRQSLFLLYNRIHVEGLINNSTDQPYFFFMGDSLGFQIYVTVRCEIYSHSNIILSQPPFHYNSSLMSSLTEQAKYKNNQFLRRDFPCSLSCTDKNYLRTEGLKRDYRHGLSPCQGCPDGNLTHRSPLNHPEVFDMLYEIPLSVRVLVLDAGAWFISDSLRGEDSSAVYKETLEAFIPHLAYFQKQRNYQLDIYFLPLPGVDPSLAKSPSHEWSRYEEKNQILYTLFSPRSLAAHNLTVTILPNDELFQRKHLINGATNVFLPDNLHYCTPGAFSPNSFLFELIAHNHVIKKLEISTDS